MSGWGGSFTLSTEQFNWRILDIDEENDKLTIVSDGITAKEFSLSGARGYNNGVGLLNLTGQRCYSNQKLNAVGRSINLDDINKLLTTSIYELRITVANGKSGSMYPIIHSMEEYSNLNNELLLPGSQWTPGEKAWGASEQKRFIPSTKLPDYNPGIAVSSNEIKSVAFDKVTYYFTGTDAPISFKTSTAKEMMTKSITNGELINGYLLASRVTSCTSSTGHSVSFSIPIITNIAVSINTGFALSSSHSESDKVYFIRPAVDIPLSGTILGTSRKWTSKYSMDIITRLKIRKVLKVKRR